MEIIIYDFDDYKLIFNYLHKLGIDLNTSSYLSLEGYDKYEIQVNNQLNEKQYRGLIDFLPYFNKIIIINKF